MSFTPGTHDSSTTWGVFTDQAAASLLIDNMGGRVKDIGGTRIVIGAFIKSGASEGMASWTSDNGANVVATAGSSEIVVTWNVN